MPSSEEGLSGAVVTVKHELKNGKSVFVRYSGVYGITLMDPCTCLELAAFVS